MRSRDTLIELENIPILYQYLYMNEDHFITVDNGLCKLEIRMNEDGGFHAKNLNFPDCPDLDYTAVMYVSNILAIIDQLRSADSVEFPNKFQNRWEEIKSITLINMALNKK